MFGKLSSLLNNVSIRGKLILLVLLPLLAMVYLIIIEVGAYLDESREAKLAALMAGFNETGFTVVTQLQLERGFTSLYMASGGTTGNRRLTSQQAESDRTLPAFRTAIQHLVDGDLDADLNTGLASLAASLEQLPGHRKAVLERSIRTDDALAFYTQIIGRYVELLGTVARLTHDSYMEETLLVFENTVLITEANGLQRAQLGGALSNSRWNSRQQRDQLERLTAKEEAYLDFVRSLASDVVKSELTALLNDATVVEASRMRDQVLATEFGAPLSGDPEEWFRIQTAKTNRYGDLVKAVIQQLNQHEQRLASAARTDFLVVVVVLVIAALAVLILVTTMRGIITPISRTMEVMDLMGQGDLSVRLEMTRSDEIGRMANAVDEFAQNLSDAQGGMVRIQNMVESANINIMMADRDLNLVYLNAASLSTLEKLEAYLPVKASEMLGQSIDIFHKDPGYQRRILSDPANLPHTAEIQLGPEWLDLNVVAIMDKDGAYIGPMLSWSIITREKANSQRDEQVRVQVADIAQELTTASNALVSLANVMASNAEENSAQATNVSASAEQVSHNVSSVATAVEEMSATIKEIAKTVLQSSNVTQNAVGRSRQAGELISQLSENSKEIGAITEVITSIAQQTNILALNATIEAARAGEAGKGFAVVANEVKELANQTSKATDEIAGKIDSIQKNAVEVVESVEEINKIMQEVDTLSTTVSSAVEEQATTTNEITRNMTETSTGVNDIVKNITGVAQAAEDNSKKSQETKDSADALGQLAQRLQDLVKLFEATAN